LRSIGITEPVKITLLNVGLAVSNFIFAMAAAVNVDKFGRRKLFLTSCTGMFLCYAIIMGLSAGFASSRTASLGTAV
jgi:MFS family permease